MGPIRALEAFYKGSIRGFYKGSKGSTRALRVLHRC